MDPKRTPIEPGFAPVRALKSRALALSASVAVHLLAIVALLSIGRAMARPQTRWIVAYLIDAPGGGAHIAPPGTSRPWARAPAQPYRARTRHLHVVARLRPRHRNRAREKIYVSARATRVTPAARAETPPLVLDHAVGPTQVRPSAAPGAQTDGRDAVEGPPGERSGKAAGVGGGDGIGRGSSLAYARYADNPAPAYPAEARLRGEEGTVIVRVLVAADGSVRRVEIANSSGFELLDREAMRTVRARWRFVPAKRSGDAVESWVLVPIRFVLR